MVIPSSFHTYTLLWSYSGHSLIIPARFTTNWPRLWCQWWLVYTCLIEVCLALGTKAETKTTANGPKEETKSETTLTTSALKQDPRFKTTNILIKHVDICTMCIKRVDICTMCIKHVDILETKPFFPSNGLTAKRWVMKFVTDPVSVLGAGVFGNVEESDLIGPLDGMEQI